MDKPSTHTLSVGDQIVVTIDGRDYRMSVWDVSPPGSMGRAVSAGPRIGAHLNPGGYAISFDDRSTFLTWGHA